MRYNGGHANVENLYRGNAMGVAGSFYNPTMVAAETGRDQTLDFKVSS